jgi:hypothetical protein
MADGSDGAHAALFLPSDESRWPRLSGSFCAVIEEDDQQAIIIAAEAFGPENPGLASDAFRACGARPRH